MFLKNKNIIFKIRRSKVTDYAALRPNKKISRFRVTDLKILGRIGTHIFFIIYFLEKI